MQTGAAARKRTKKEYTLHRAKIQPVFWIKHGKKPVLFVCFARGGGNSATKNPPRFCPTAENMI
jgi:hypothetical protein